MLAVLVPAFAQASSPAHAISAPAGAVLLWGAALLAAGTTVAWLLGRPSAQARWPRIGFGLALLAVMVALALQLAADLGSGHSALQLRFGRHAASADTQPTRFGWMIACYLAALAASGWGAWRLLRRRR
ncbi:hypothetical protein ACYX79_13075 [Stenotrophomonas rhizophila]